MADLQTLIHRGEVGQIKPWTKAAAPTGYLLCNGAAVSRTTYADLFAVIAATYGAGDGSSTFNVPNLAGKMPQGYDSSNYAVAATGGANTVTVSLTNNQAVGLTNNQAVTVTGSIDNTSLTEAQVASHDHDITGSPYGNARALSAHSGGPSVGSGDTNPGNPRRTVFTPGISNAGSGTGHNHSHTLTGTMTGTVTGTLTGTVTGSGTNSFSPYLVINYVIKY